MNPFSKIDLSKFAGLMRSAAASASDAKARVKKRIREERQCTGTTEKGKRCEAFAVVGNPEKRCYRHGGAETAKIPRKQRIPACSCRAYQFPHRQRSGLCNYPGEPFGESKTPRGQRRYYKRIRKAKIKRWLESVGT